MIYLCKILSGRKHYNEVILMKCYKMSRVWESDTSQNVSKSAVLHEQGRTIQSGIQHLYNKCPLLQVGVMQLP